MKTLNFKLTGVIIFSLLSVSAFAQFDWHQGGNGAFPPPADVSIPFNQLLGTTTNFPLRIITNNTEKIHINETRTTTIGTGINSFNVNTTGFVGIGPNSIHPFRHPNGVWTDIGPFTLLHLHGVSSANDFAQTWGYRNWMRTGISFTDQTDFAYVGNRSVDAANNLNEFTICWSNDGGSGPVPNPDIHGGPDDMVFRFTSAFEGFGANPNDFTQTGDMDGRHIARFTPGGFFGLGPNFGHTIGNSAYVRPQSMFHMSSFQQEEAWMQVTNQTGTEETVNDGLRIGVTGTGTAHIKQQEDLPLILSIIGIPTAQIVPGQSTYMTSLGMGSYGMMGVGDFYPPFGPPIDAKLDINGDLRIRQVGENPALTQVLVIDENDQNRVYWRSVDGLGGIGNYCSDPQNSLTSNYEIALDNANYYFSKQGDFTNGVGIGLPCGTPISYARLKVLQSSRNSSFNPGVNIAGLFNNIAGGSYSVGVFADAVTTGANNIGGYFNASGGSSNNFGIYCTAPVVPATPGSYSNNLALFADGDSYVSGIPFITQPAQLVSDQQFKTNINPLNNALEIINQLQPKTFNYDENSRINFQSGIQYGLIAQEVEPILPHLVMESVIPAEFDSLGNIINPAIPYKSLNYNAFFAILMKGMQEQQSSIDSLKAINNDLETRLTYLENCIRNANICTEGNRTMNIEPDDNTNYKNVELTNVNSIILDQNLPNPFKENTVINYNIPTEVAEAKLLFYDLNGRIIKELIIEERGESKLTVYGANLKTGIYAYSLIADGELIATKKMVKK